MKPLESFINFFMNLVFDSFGIVSALIVVFFAWIFSRRGGRSPGIRDEIKSVAFVFFMSICFVFIMASLNETLKRGDLSGDILTPILFVVTSVLPTLIVAIVWIVAGIFQKVRSDG